MVQLCLLAVGGLVFRATGGSCVVVVVLLPLLAVTPVGRGRGVFAGRTALVGQELLQPSGHALFSRPLGSTCRQRARHDRIRLLLLLVVHDAARGKPTRNRRGAARRRGIVSVPMAASSANQPRFPTASRGSVGSCGCSRCSHCLLWANQRTKVTKEGFLFRAWWKGSKFSFLEIRLGI